MGPEGRRAHHRRAGAGVRLPRPAPRSLPRRGPGRGGRDGHEPRAQHGAHGHDRRPFRGGPAHRQRDHRGQPGPGRRPPRRADLLKRRAPPDTRPPGCRRGVRPGPAPLVPECAASQRPDVDRAARVALHRRGQRRLRARVLAPRWHDVRDRHPAGPVASVGPHARCAGHRVGFGVRGRRQRHGGGGAVRREGRPRGRPGRAVPRRPAGRGGGNRSRAADRARSQRPPAGRGHAHHPPSAAGGRTNGGGPHHGAHRRRTLDGDHAGTRLRA